MRNLIKFHIYWMILAFFITPIFASAQWSFVNKVDDFTDKKVAFTVFSDDSHQIQISHQGSSVWMFITRKKLGTFEPNGIIELRVDTNKTMTIDPEKCKLLSEYIGPTFQWEPKTVSFLLWHGKETEGCGYVGELLEGKELNIRYQINSMEREAFKISLVGAKEAIINGLGLTICGH